LVKKKAEIPAAWPTIDKEKRKSVALQPPSPAGAAFAERILEDFGISTKATPSQIRNVVINKLLVEADNPQATVRVRALELLGKIREVGLFSERTETVVTHQTSEELRAKLLDRLQKLRSLSPQGANHEPVLIEEGKVVPQRSPKAVLHPVLDILDLMEGEIVLAQPDLPWVAHP
jgi:hypothetical protein